MPITGDMLLKEMKSFKEYAGFDGGISKLEKIVDEFEENNHPTTPGNPSREIKSVTETAYQRAIFYDKAGSILKLTPNEDAHVIWKDLEVPLTFSGNSRRACADLIGRSRDNYIIGELKYYNNSSNMRPEYAIFEVLIYYWLITENIDGLMEHNVSHEGYDISWEAFFGEEQYLVVGANKKYWDYWLKSGTNDKFSYRKAAKNNEQGFDKKSSNGENLSSLVKYLNRKYSVNIICFKTPDCDFEAQKGEKETYIPELDNTQPFLWERLFDNND